MFRCCHCYRRFIWNFLFRCNILVLGTVKGSPFELIPLVDTSLGYNIFGWFPYFGKTSKIQLIDDVGDKIFIKFGPTDFYFIFVKFFGSNTYLDTVNLSTKAIESILDNAILVTIVTKNANLIVRTFDLVKTTELLLSYVKTHLF